MKKLEHRHTTPPSGVGGLVGGLFSPFGGWGVVLLVLFLMTACDDNRVYDYFVHTSKNGWEKTDHIDFPVPAITAKGNYDIVLQLRTDHTFPFKNIVLISDCKVLPADKVVSDTLTCRLTDNQGNKLGPGINLFQYSFPINKMLLNKGDSLHISVHHDMKREMLPGIVDVGIKIQKH